MLTNAYLRLVTMFTVLAAALGERLRPRRAGLAGARGVTFIEYALLAGIAVVIAVIFHTELAKIFTSLLGRISNGVAGGNQG